FFFLAEDGIRDRTVTGVQTCALPICLVVILAEIELVVEVADDDDRVAAHRDAVRGILACGAERAHPLELAICGELGEERVGLAEIGRASCRERVESSVVGGARKEKSK